MNLKSLFSLLAITLSISAFSQIHWVTNLQDSGPGSFRNAVASAYEDDTVQFSANVLGGSNTLQLNSTVDVDSSMTILGAIQGGDTLQITAIAGSRALNINPDIRISFDHITIKDIIFRDCQAPFNGTFVLDNGGAILVYQATTLNLENCVFRNNQCGDGNAGGAVFGFCSLNMRNCLFMNNTAGTGGSSSISAGGAVAISGGVTAEDCSFMNNSGGEFAGALGASSDYFHLIRCHFENNFTYNTTGEGGGAVWINGTNNTNLKKCTFVNNQSASEGGAFMSSFLSAYSDSTFEDCTFEDNSAAGEGGAIYAFGGDTIRVNRCTFANNSSGVTSGNGGGNAVSMTDDLLSITNSTFYNNPSPSVKLNPISGVGVLNLENVTIYNSNSSSKPLVVSSSTTTLNIEGSIFHQLGTSASISASGTVNNSGYNLFSDNPTFSISNDLTNISNSSLALEPLGNYGGYTQTAPPHNMSLALETGNPTKYNDAQNGPIFGIRDRGAGERQVIENDTVVACEAYLWRGKLLKESGLYVDTVANGNTIDSIHNLNLDVTIIDTTITITPFGFVANEQDSNATYQWLDCDFLIRPIPGATDSILNLPFSTGYEGSTALIINKNGCSDTIDCFYYSTISIDESSGNRLQVFPNPALSSINVISDFPTSAFSIYDSRGAQIMRGKLDSDRIDLVQLPIGIYILRVQFENGGEKRVRLIKQ